MLINISIDVHGESEASGIAYLSLYRHIGPESLLAAAVEFSVPSGVGTMKIDLCRQQQGGASARWICIWPAETSPTFNPINPDWASVDSAGIF